MAIPPAVVSAGRVAYDLYDPAVPVVHICFDSLLDLPPSGCTSARRVVFEDTSVRIEVLVQRELGECDLELCCTPGTDADVELLRDDCEERVVVTCVAGRAVIRHFRSGLTSLLLRRDLSCGGNVRTAWVVL